MFYQNQVKDVTVGEVTVRATDGWLECSGTICREKIRCEISAEVADDDDVEATDAVMTRARLSPNSTMPTSL